MTDGQEPEVCLETDKPTKRRISKALKKFRRSFAWAAANLHVSTTALSRWLSGETGSPRIERQVPLLLTMIEELIQAKGAFLPPKKKARRKRKRRAKAAAEPEVGGK
jgi:hypothetical protein